MSITVQIPTCWLGDAKAWRECLESDPEVIERLRQRTRSGRVLGSERFVLRAEQTLFRRLRPLPRGRRKKRLTRKK